MIDQRNITESEKKKAFEIVLEELKKCGLFCGIYDAKNGNESFMYGIETVMECIAFYAGDEEFSRDFSGNMVKSNDRELKDTVYRVNNPAPKGTGLEMRA